MKRLTTLQPKVRTLQTSIGRALPTGTPRIRGRKLMERNARLSMRRPLCEDCLDEGLTTAGEEWDHVIPLAEGGADHESNMRHLCKDHHNRKSIADAKRAGRLPP